MSERSSPEPFRIEPVKLTWAALLGHWVDVSRAAVALPEDADSQRLKRLLPDVIMLQAVWFSLQHLDELDAAERALGLDRAAVLIDRHERAIREAWGDAEPPDALRELIADARQQLAAAAGQGGQP